MRKISIVTINYNSGITISRTIESILQQTYDNIEWIVVDGNSCDESKNILERNVINFDKYISEPDRGISHAMNKGIALCSGEIVVFMNAGDSFYARTSLSDIIYLWDYDRYDWITAGASVCSEDLVLLYERLPANSDWRSLLVNGCKIFHGSTFIKVSTIREFHGFSENYKSSMDYDLWLRLVGSNNFPQIVNLLVSIFYVGGTSSNLLRRYFEDQKSRAKNGYHFYMRECVLFGIACFKYLVRDLKRYKVIYKIKEFMGV
jgi:glycosyltransferase involved in cell wall biosynthesis